MTFERLLPSTRLVALGLAALLAGCAHPIAKYVPDASVPSAQLVMRGKLQPGETYGVYLFREPLSCTGVQQVGVGLVNVDPATTTIAAGLTTAEVFLTKPNRAVCRVRWSFEPVAGRKYLVAAASTPTGCSARILDATDPHKIVPEPSLRRRDAAGRTCVPLAQTTTLAETTSRAQANGESELPIPADAATPAPPKAGASALGKPAGQ